MENINQLKLGFLDYLKEKYQDDSSAQISSPDLSIFMYSSDFQDYLSDKGYSDTSIFSQSISDIKGIFTQKTDNTDNSNIFSSSFADDEENVLNDNFMINTLTNAVEQDEDLFAAFNTNSNDTIEQDEIIEFLDLVDNQMQLNPDIYENTFDGISKEIQNIKNESSNQMPQESILDAIYNSDAALEYIDLDKDGEISDLEKELFESFVQGDNEELSAEDLQNALKAMEDGTFNYDLKIPEDAVPVQDIPDTAASGSKPGSENISARQTSNPAQNLSPTGRTSGGASAGMPSGVQSAPSNTDEMNLEQLKKEKEIRQNNADSAKNDADKAVSDINELKSGEYSEAKENYDKAVENDENISEELKEKRDNNLEATENTINEITSLNSDISQTETDLGDASNKLNSDKSTLSALKSALSSFDGAENQGETASKKAEIQEQINTLEQTAIPADEKRQKELDDKLNGNDGLKKQLEQKQDELNDLEAEKAEIEQEISKTGSEETKEALKEFQEVEKKLDELVENLPSLQEKLAKAQSELEEINELIRTKEAEQLKSEKSYYNSSLPSGLTTALDNKLGSGFSAKLEQVAKNLNCEPSDLLGMMQSESGINPKAYNNNGGATGLIQFMPSTAKSLGTSTQALLNMSASEQLDYVEKYFKNLTGGSGQKLTGGDLYTLCFLPAYLNREVLCSSSGDTAKYYNANSGLDADGDGNITKTELNNRIQNKYKEVLSQYGVA